MGKKNTILIADDMEFNRELYKTMFPERDIIETSNGAEAIKEYEKHRGEVCAVLTDIMMPMVNGLTLLEFFSKSHYIDEVPVFVISADSSDKVVTKAFQLGAEDVITKPFKTNFVKKHIDHIIELFELRAQADSFLVPEFDEDFE